MDTTLSSLSSTTIMAATLIRAISSPYSHDRSPLSEIEALERGALAVIVSFKNGHLSRRSSASSFLSLSTTFSTSSLLSSADVAAAAEKGVLKRGGDWVNGGIDDASATSGSVTAGHLSSDEESASQLPPKKRICRGYVVDAETAWSDSNAAAVPEETSVPASLYADGDEEHINPIHNIIRRDILEVFVEMPSSNFAAGADDVAGSGNSKAVKAKQSRFAGRIGLRCRFCKHLPVGANANLATIYPETLEGIYRACSVRFQKRHIGSCAFIPESIMSQLGAHAKEKSCRGSKNYWVESALRKGFRTSEDNKGIVFCPEIKH